MKKGALNKTICFFLVLLLAVSFLPVCVLAADTRFSYGPREVQIFKYSEVWANKNDILSREDVMEKAYSGSAMTLTSSDEKVATIDVANGTTTLYQPGSTVIHATLQNGDYDSYVLHVYQIKVEQPVITMKKGETTQNAVQLIAEEPRNMDLVLAYSSDHEDVVTVDENGVLYAVAEGTAVIEVRVSNSRVAEPFTVEVTDPETVVPENDEGAHEVPPSDIDDTGTKTDAETTAPEDADGTQEVITPEPPAETPTEPANATTETPTKPANATTETPTEPANTTIKTPTKAPETPSKTTPNTETTISKTTVTTSKTTSKTTVKISKTAPVTSTPAAKTTHKVSTPTAKATATTPKMTSVASSDSVETEPQVSADHSTAAVPEGVIDESPIPTAAFVNPAGGNDLIPDGDNMASHAGAVAGMLAAAAAGGAVGALKAYKVKKYEADV